MSDRPRRAPSARPPTSPEAPTSEPSPSDLSSSPSGSSPEAVPSDARPPRRKSRATRSTRPDESQLAETAPTEPSPTRASTSRGSNGAPAAVEGPRRERGGRRQRSGDDLDVGYQVGPAPDAPLASSDDDRGPRPVVEPVWPRFAVTLDEERIDPDVQKVVRRLVRHGYEAYLVGGCVRDLLLGGKPKDFDVATSARPEQVRELFRNSRVIGRRFRLVHVLFHAGKVIEVATFRRNPNDDLDETDAAKSPGHDGAQLLIRSDNVFGEAHEDATRRDFTINALFYDVEACQILDWVGGLEDVRGRMVNTIGEPEVRFREDPVRILRALKFAGRLDLGIHPDVYDSIVTCRDALELAARPRVAEEVLRLLRGGGARRTMFLAWETGVLDVLMPELAALLYDSFASESPSSPGHRVFRLLEFIDRRTLELGSRDDTVLWTLLLLEPLKEATEGARDRSQAVSEFLDPLLERLAIPRRFADGMRRILSVLPRILSGKAGRFARTEIFELALEVAEADLYARGLSTDAIKALRSAPREAAPRETGGRASAAKDEPARAAASTGRGHRASSHGRSRPTPRH